MSTLQYGNRPDCNFWKDDNQTLKSIISYDKEKGKVTVDASYIRASGYEVGYHYVKCAKIDEYANVKNKKRKKDSRVCL